MGDQRTDASEAFGYPVEGIGGSYNRDADHWVLYTMPDTKPFATVMCYDKARLDWVIGALRGAIRPAAPTTNWQPLPDPTEAAPFDGKPCLLSVRNTLGTLYGGDGEKLDPEEPFMFYIGKWRSDVFQTTEEQWGEWVSLAPSEVWRWAPIAMPEIEP